MFKTKNHFEIIPITVVACTKDHRLQGIDVLKVDTSKLVNSMELEEQEIRLFKDYKASIRLKKNYHPRYIQARQLPIHILPIVVSKLKKNDSAGYFGKGHSTTRYVRIHFLYQVLKLPVMNWQIRKHFAKIDFKSAYNQIKIDNKFKEITTLNTPMELLRWSHFPFGINQSCICPESSCRQNTIILTVKRKH